MTRPRMESALIAARAAQARIERKRRQAQIAQHWLESPVGDASKINLSVKPRRILRPVY
jgi:hypothetical protein